MKKFTKLTMLLLLFFTLASVASAQPTGKRASSLSRLLQKHVYNGEYPLPPLKVESPTLMSRAKNALGAPLEEKVWFPGEWEEVKAVVVSPRYEFLIPGYENDKRYYANQLVKNWGYWYYQESSTSKAQLLYEDVRPCSSRVDVETNDGFIPLYLMDAIQKAGAEAWVRIEKEGDEQLVRTAMKNAGLQTDKMEFFVSPGNSIWFRDCGPICFYYGDDDKKGMLDFLYDVRRPLDDLLPSVLHWKFGIPNYINDLMWEGGNCLVDGVGGLITSTSTYKHNEGTTGPMWWDGSNPETIRWNPKAALSPADIKYNLNGLVGQRQTNIIPTLNYDGGTGHIDLYLDAIDENAIYMTQMPEEYSWWTDYDIALGNSVILFNKKSFHQRAFYNRGAIPFPSYDNGSKWQSEEEYGGFARTYANHLICNGYIIQPCFSPVDANHMPTAEWDLANIQTMQKLYPGYKFYCIDMRSFDGSGGSIHCITKQIPADNPVRIIHKDIYGDVNPGTLGYIPFSAIITNKSGISEASVYYSINDGAWSQAAMTNKDNGNCWHVDIDLNNLTGGNPIPAEGINVYYYISATSENGKTITKPFNAINGTLYSFTLTTSVKYDENMFDFSVDPIDEGSIKFSLDNALIREDTSEDPTGVIEIQESESPKAATPSSGWYTIDGMPLSTRPSAKGIYLFGGKKVVIK